MGGRGPPALPTRRRRAAAHVRLRRTPARRSSRCSSRRRRWSRACRSTRRSSTSAGCVGCRAAPRRSPRGARRGAEKVGLAITVGVASTKFLAKVASGVAKPDGLLVVPAGARSSSCTRCRSSGCGASGRSRRRSSTPAASPRSADVARLDEEVLVTILGRASGHHLHALAHNRDPRRVEVGRRRRSIGSQHALGRRPKTRQSVDAVLVGIVERVSRRLRAARRVGRTVVLRLRFDDFSRATRSRTLPEATAHTPTILTAARSLLADVWPTVERPGPHARRPRRRQPRRRRCRPARAPLRPAQRRRPRRRPRQRPRPVRLEVRRAGSPARARPRVGRCRCSRTEYRTVTTPLGATGLRSCR